MYVKVPTRLYSRGRHQYYNYRARSNLLYPFTSIAANLVHTDSTIAQWVWSEHEHGTAEGSWSHVPTCSKCACDKTHKWIAHLLNTSYKNSQPFENEVVVTSTCMNYKSRLQEWRGITPKRLGENAVQPTVYTMDKFMVCQNMCYMRVMYMRSFSRELMTFHTHNALSSVVTLTTCSWTGSQEAEEMTHTLP